MNILIYLIGFAAIASTYLPEPFDNICYPLLILFLFLLLKFGRTRYTKYFEINNPDAKITFRNVLVYGATIVICVILLISLLTIFLIRNDPTYKPVGLTPYGEFLYRLAKSF